MLTSTRHECLAALFLALFATKAEAQTAASAPQASNSIDQLVVGDGYTIDVKRHDVQERYEGFLLKANDRWIILGHLISEGRNEYGVPVLEDIPYVNRYFKHVGIGRETVWTWIPREAATIQGRVRATGPLEIEIPEADTPPLSSCRVELAKNGKLTEQYGDFKEEGADQLGFDQEVVEASVEKVPYAGDLPLVGRAFRKETSITRQVHHRVEQGDILSICMPSIRNEVPPEDGPPTKWQRPRLFGLRGF